MRHASTLRLTEAAAHLRVHFVVHHHRDRAAGASGATLALGDALQQLGCGVSFFFFDDAFGDARHSEIQRMLRFPWRVASHLARAAQGIDVVDATSGDAWVWCARGRPGATGATLVTRAHGLEHMTSRDLRRRSRAGQVTLSWKYPVYHGGYRLWEVQRSMTCADGQVFLNDPDRDHAMAEFGVRADTSVVLPNGVPDRLLGIAPVTPRTDASSPIALAFVGSWIPRKGTRAVVDMAVALHASGIPFSLRLLGTGMDRVSVLDEFPAGVREHVSVSAYFAPEELPGLLDGADILVHPSWTEGFSLALVEGMACGLAPVATASGGAASVIRNGETGLLLHDESALSLADAVTRLAADRALLGRLRVSAQLEMQRLRWSTVAARTLTFYRAMMDRRASIVART